MVLKSKNKLNTVNATKAELEFKMDAYMQINFILNLTFWWNLYGISKKLKTILKSWKNLEKYNHK